jgi:cytochrome c-type biogenesis protein CcmF
MFIGALIFVISAAQITWDTSLPVTNKLFGTNLALGTEVVSHYNKVQIIIGIFMAIGAAGVQYLSYKKGKVNRFVKYLLFSLVLSLLSTVGLGFFFEFPFIIEYQLGENSYQFVSTYWLLLLTSSLAFYSNLFYILTVVKGKIWQWSGSIAHIGFALFLIGILISQGRQETISINTMGIDYGEGFQEEDKQTNIFLPQGDTVVMKDYWVSYQGRQDDGKKELFKVYYEKLNDKGEAVEQFFLYPDAQVNQGMGLVSNPDTKHYLTKDIFTHVTSIPEKPKPVEAQLIEMQVGDTIFTTKHFTILEKVLSNPVNETYVFNDTLLGLGAQLRINGFDDYERSIIPLYLINLNDGSVESPEQQDLGSSLSFQILAFDPQTETLSLAVKDSSGSEDFIIMKAIVFPYINVLWLGGIIMLLGAFMSSVKRYIQ